MKILYLPLDERPCNYIYPQQIAALGCDTEMLVPPLTLLGDKKRPADTAALKSWLESHIAGCDAAIIAVEMLLYGGLVPSRLHNIPGEELLEAVTFIEQLKTAHPAVRFYAGSLIMRTPSYSSDDEEPEYYEQYGKAIFRHGWLTDKHSREGLDANEQSELDELRLRIPAKHLADYTARRAKNINALATVLQLVKRGIIEFMVIPQDDSAPYGYTAIDQKYIYGLIAGERLQSKAHVYPGADEMGCTLLARATLSGCAVFPFYSAGNADNIIPLFEDRPLGESLRAQLLAAGCEVVCCPGEADAILAVNAPGKFMQQAYEQGQKDVSYSTYRNLRLFTDNIRRYLEGGYPVAVADCAFANGGDSELIRMLDDARLLDEIAAYAGWNTNCNTLGTVISALLQARRATADPRKITAFKQFRLLEDWCYQADVRQSLLRDIAGLAKEAPDDAGLQRKLQQITDGMGFHVLFPPEYSDTAARRMLTLWTDNIINSFKTAPLHAIHLSHPWRRAFEIRIDAIATLPVD